MSNIIPIFNVKFFLRKFNCLSESLEYLFFHQLLRTDYIFKLGFTICLYIVFRVQIYKKCKRAVHEGIYKDYVFTTNANQGLKMFLPQRH